MESGLLGRTAWGAAAAVASGAILALVVGAAVPLRGHLLVACGRRVRLAPPFPASAQKGISNLELLLAKLHPCRRLGAAAIGHL